MAALADWQHHFFLVGIHCVCKLLAVGFGRLRAPAAIPEEQMGVVHLVPSPPMRSGTAVSHLRPKQGGLGVHQK